MVARELKAGREACVAKINADGGVRGRSLVLLTRDDKGDPAVAVDQAETLADKDHAVALLGPVGRGVQDAILRWSSGAGVAVIDPYGGGMASRVPAFENAFFLTANYSVEGERIASHMAELGIKDVAVVYVENDQGLESLLALEEPMSVLGLHRTWTGTVRRDGADARSRVEALLAAHPQALVLATTGPATAALLKALREHGGPIQLAIPTYGLSSAATEAELRTLGAEARGFIMTQVVPSPRDTLVGIVAMYRSALPTGGEPTYVGLQGCMDVVLLAEAFKRRSGDVNRASTLSLLREAGKVNLGNFGVDLDPHLKLGSRFTDIVLIDGRGRIVR